MVHKLQPARPVKPSTRKSKSPTCKPPPPSTPSERLEAVLQRAPARGLKPMNEAELSRFIEAHCAAWRDEAEIDAFISWLHRERTEGIA